MQYFSRAEVERIGQAGSALLVEPGKPPAYRFLSSFWLYCEPDDTAFTPHGVEGFWEAWITTWVSQQFDTHNLFVDVGANVGYYSMMAAKAGLNTVAFEPNPSVLKLLQDSATLNRVRNFWTINAAASDKEGEELFTVPHLHSGNGSMLSALGEREGNTFSVETVTLDYILQFHKGGHVLIKIDAEGAEPAIWEGMQQTLTERQVTTFLEWEGSRWDREKFAKRLFENDNLVSFIRYDGGEDPLIHWSQLAAKDGFETVVVRNYGRLSE